MTKGLIIGKFYPPHEGHHYLIDSARDQCDELLVMLLWSRVETMAMAKRLHCLRMEHPNCTVVEAQDENPIDYSDEGWNKHTIIMEDTLLKYGFHPDILFSSEYYGPELAERLSIPEHRFIDLDRDKYPISGTKMRQDIVGNWEFLAPSTKAALCKRVVICGAESTGTTTLAKELAEHYATPCVPEMGRHYDWAVGKTHKWTEQDFIRIAEEQRHWENMLAAEAHSGVLICDTDEFATAMFAEVYLGEAGKQVSHQVEMLAEQSYADLYIVTSDVDVPFEDDGTRYNSGKRPWMTQWFKNVLPADRTILVAGSRQDRFLRARMRINTLLETFYFSDPLGEVHGGIARTH